MFNTSDISQLLKYLAEYEESHSQSSMNEFIAWLHIKLNGRKTSPVKFENLNEEDLNRELCWLLNRLHKFERYYLRYSFKELPISSAEEFWFLNEISKLNKPAKTEVYENTLTELPSGTQIMKRLQSANLVKESGDELDRRVRRIQLTPVGESVRKSASDNLIFHNRLRMGNLEYNQKETLLIILRQVNDYHSKYYREADGLPVKELINKLDQRLG